mmetsp:Transcript_22272/g.87757  ORF Transcript_22272/g.87757 Transcript_22272/m.87757 type:complete len:276 (+) Transcript_22272:661-1488(+)
MRAACFCRLMSSCTAFCSLSRSASSRRARAVSSSALCFATALRNDESLLSSCFTRRLCSFASDLAVRSRSNASMAFCSSSCSRRFNDCSRFSQTRVRASKLACMVSIWRRRGLELSAMLVLSSCFMVSASWKRLCISWICLRSSSSRHSYLSDVRVISARSSSTVWLSASSRSRASAWACRICCVYSSLRLASRSKSFCSVSVSLPVFARFCSPSSCHACSSAFCSSSTCACAASAASFCCSSFFAVDSESCFMFVVDSLYLAVSAPSSFTLALS